MIAVLTSPESTNRLHPSQKTQQQESRPDSRHKYLITCIYRMTGWHGLHLIATRVHFHGL